MENEEELVVGVSYIGSRAVHRLIVGHKDYRPYCFHFHENDEEAKSCKYALEMLELGTVAPFPIDEKRKK